MLGFEMAEDLGDGEFWLPPKFLCEEDLFMEVGKTKQESKRSYEFGNGLTRPNSDMSSSGESVVGSTDSNEDDYLAGLNQRFTHSTLSDDFCNMKNNKWSSTLSPQSTLCNGSKQGGSSPICTSPLVGQKETPYGLLYAAAGEVVKMKQNEQAAKARSFSNTPALAPAPHFGAPRKPNPNFVLTNNQNLDPSMSNQFQQLKQHQELKQQQQCNIRWGHQQGAIQNRGRNGRPLGLLSPSAWPTVQQSLQPQPGSGMKPLFHGNPGANRQSSGTGVFIPRPRGTATQTVKKADKVVQSLNLNLKTMDASAEVQYRYSTSNNAVVSCDYDAALKFRNRVLMEEAEAQKRWKAAIRPQPVSTSNEIQLPQEWTY